MDESIESKSGGHVSRYRACGSGDHAAGSAHGAGEQSSLDFLDKTRKGGSWVGGIMSTQVAMHVR